MDPHLRKVLGRPLFRLAMWILKIDARLAGAKVAIRDATDDEVREKEVIAIARDPHYSDEFIGQLYRSLIGMTDD